MKEEYQLTVSAEPHICSETGAINAIQQVLNLLIASEVRGDAIRTKIRVLKHLLQKAEDGAL